MRPAEKQAIQSEPLKALSGHHWLRGWALVLLGRAFLVNHAAGTPQPQMQLILVHPRPSAILATMTRALSSACRVCHRKGP